MKKKSNFTANLVGLISIVIIFIIGSVLVDAIGNMDIKIPISNDTKSSSIGGKDDVGKSEDKLNMLIVGMGGGDHDAPDLTDTIILASLNFEKEIISMLSIPRDLYVEYPDGNHGKINEIYRKFGVNKGDKELGMKSLMKKITQITGEEIDNYVAIDFEGFKKVIDEFGGVDITLEEQFVDDMYPDGAGGHTTFILRKGTWTLDGKVALKYVRSRYTTSDFDRSNRQQQVISALKSKIIEGGFIKNSGKIKGLYNIFKEYVETDIDLNAVLKLGSERNTLKSMQVQSFNLNDSCFYGSSTCSRGGLLYVPLRELFGNLSVLLAEGTSIIDLNNYLKVHKYADIIFNYQEIFNENYKINIFNSVKINNLASYYTNEITKYGFNIPEYNSIGNTNKKYEKSIIYYNSISGDSKTLQGLKLFFNGEIKEAPYPILSKDDEVKIELILGSDYEDVFNF